MTLSDSDRCDKTPIYIRSLSHTFPLKQAPYKDRELLHFDSRAVMDG